MRTRVWWTSLVLASLAVACGDQPTEVVPEREMTQGPGMTADATSSSDDGLLITTNKDDYLPGDTVWFTGAGWPANDVLDIVLEDDPATHPPHTWTIPVSEDGTFRDSTYVVDVDDIGVTFTLTATSQATGRSLTVTFTDNRMITKAELLDPSTSAFVTLTQPPAAAVQVSVGAGDAITARITATTNTLGTGAAWQSTEWQIVNSSNVVVASGCDNGVNVTVATVGAQHTFNITAPAAGGTYRLRFQAFRLDGCTGSGPSAQENYPAALVVVANVAPVVDAGGPYSGNEGSGILFDAPFPPPSASDADGDALLYKWTYTAGIDVDAGTTCSFDDDEVLKPTFTCTDDGTFTVTLEVDDQHGHKVTDDATVNVANVPPEITAVVLTPFVDGYVYPITGQPTVDATYTDQGSHDTHTCVFEVLDYQNLEVGTDRTCGSGLGAVEAGVYSVKVTVTDDDGDSDIEYVQVVIYDPSAGFVTGGGWIYSYAGAYKAEMSLEGKATFGFVSKYQKGATVPSGNTEFVFHAGNLNFHSSWYDWLVVNAVGTRAQYKGKGTINGGATMYLFILTALDGKTSGPDQFRMQIFEPDGETVLYDSYVSGPATDQPLSGGSIVIHTGKK
jgi:hypothetical protein